MTVPGVGDPAPEIDLTTDSGRPFQLSAHLGHPVVLYFYPEDDTEGCTIENIEFSKLLPQFRKIGVAVVGISPDTVAKHCRFRDRHRLKIPLAADPERHAIEAYGLWVPKKTFGREYLGVKRTTVLVGPDGRIAALWTVTRIKGHAAVVLDTARTLILDLA